MIIKYNIAKIKELLNDFHKLTNLTISVWDTELNQLAFCPPQMPEFCRLVKSSPLGKKRCLQSDLEACSCCKQTLEPITHKCHAGLVDTAIPIIFNGTVMGFIMFGQIKNQHFPKNTTDDIFKLSQELKLPYNELLDAYNNLNNFEPDLVTSATNILKSTICFLCLNDSIKFTENEMVTSINDYIINNIQNPISVTNICDEFKITKNKLYSLWNKWFGITIGDYILKQRMDKAKNLLTNTDKKIGEICIEAGISDYNYFSKVFKKYYGYSPREYRKRFPIILESK